MGFGHRVYKNRDPRATAMKRICSEVLAELGVVNPLLGGWVTSAVQFNRSPYVPR